MPRADRAGRGRGTRPTRVEFDTDMKDNKDDKETKLHEAGEYLGEAARLAKDAARAGLDQLKEGAVDYYERGKDQIESFEESLRRKVKSEPLKSVLVAAAVGLVVGFIWKRR